MRSAGRAVVAALLALCAGCTGAAETERPPATGGPATVSPSAAGDGVELPPLARLPRVWRDVPFGGPALPRQAPSDTSRLASVFDDPARARLVFHPVERITDPYGWAGEQLAFLGVDGRWRSLEMADLGLPDSSWPGPDTYGAGALSSDGRVWAAHTNTGVVFLDLATGVVRHVELPPGSAAVRYVAWVPGADVVSAYARSGAQGRSYRTFHVTPGGRVTPVSYDASRTRFDSDGTPVEIERSSTRALTVTRWSHIGQTQARWQLPSAFGKAQLHGVFGEDAVAVFEPPRSTDLGSTVLWVFDKATGYPRRGSKCRP